MIERYIGVDLASIRAWSSPLISRRACLARMMIRRHMTLAIWWISHSVSRLTIVVGVHRMWVIPRVRKLNRCLAPRGLDRSG